MKLHKLNIVLLFFLSISMIIFVTICVAFLGKSTATPLWQYQCIDTMKISRDQAVSAGKNPQFESEIAREMVIIKQLGANCVAIDTPYDEAFLPYLKLWVKQARLNNLHIWFRGNFSSWEGWFGYPKGMTTQEHLLKTKQFILAHSDLFSNGDIFTPAPEAENGWGQGYVPESDYPEFRQFLIDEKQNAQDAFTQIGKKVATNWLSMNGELAMKMLDKPTIEALDNTVTIDHYINSPDEMKSYIDYFNQEFHAKVVIGEFGAPIPDINGSMNEQEQASFVKSIFDVFYQEHDAVYGVNYWVLNGGSTALLTDNDQMKPVADVLQQYYKPMHITGIVTDETGQPVENARVIVDNQTITTTNNQGSYSFSIPQKALHITIIKNGYTTDNKIISNTNEGKLQEKSIIKSLHPSWQYKIQKAIKDMLNLTTKIFK